MSDAKLDPHALTAGYLEAVTALMTRIQNEERAPIAAAADVLSQQIAADRLIHIYGPGGHSNLGAKEVFFRAGGLMHVSAILDEGTLLSNGALRSMAVERLPGYGRIVIADHGLGAQDVLILVNAYGMNAALIDAAIEAKARGVRLIGVSSHDHAKAVPLDHPARHPSKQNLHDLVDIAIDCKVPMGDALVDIAGVEQPIAAVSTFANAFALNSLVIHTVARLAQMGIEPPIWRSGNAADGDRLNARFIEAFRGRVRSL